MNFPYLYCVYAGRVDLQCNAAGIPNFIEVKPLAELNPEHPDLPIICTKHGIPYRDLICGIMLSALERYGLLDKAPAGLLQ